MKPKPITINKEEKPPVAVIPVEILEGMKLVDGVLADLNSTNPLIYPINPNAFFRWRETLQLASNLFKVAKPDEG